MKHSEINAILFFNLNLLLQCLLHTLFLILWILGNYAVFSLRNKLKLPTYAEWPILIVTIMFDGYVILFYGVYLYNKVKHFIKRAF